MHDRGCPVMRMVGRRKRVVQCHRAAGRHDRRGEQRDGVRRATGQQPSRGHGAAACRSGRRSTASRAAAGDRAATGCAAAAETEQVRDHTKWP